MYMDILEQEVEALSAEVTRLRLMVHRVTQVMEAPAPRSDSAAVHVDPLRAAPAVAHAGTAAAPPHDLQATVDSYKQILPLVQLLLAQQQQQHQRGEERRTSRGASRSRRQQRRSRQEDHRPTKASSSSEKRRASSSSSSQASATSSATSASASDSSDGEAPLHTALPVAGAPAPEAQHADRTPASASRAATRVKAKIKVPTLAVEADSASRVGVDSVAARRHSSGEGGAAGAVGAEPGSASVLERLRAQRQREAATEQSDSSDSSNVMPMAKPQFSRTTASPMTSSARRKYVMNATTVSIVAPKEPSAAELAAAASQSLHSTSLVSSKLRQAPSKTLVQEAPVQMSASPVSSKPGSLYSGAALPASVSNSLVHSEYGAYSYGALPSAFNSPAMSHVADDPVSALRASRASLPSSRALPLESTVTQQSSKHLPQQTSALSLTPRAAASASSSSSDDSSDGEAAQLKSALQSTTKPSPFKAGLILGARQPIGVHALTGPPPPPTAPNDKRGAAFAASLSGPTAAVPARSEMLPGARPIAQTGTSSTSSSSDNAVFRPPPSQRQTAPAMHQDSSFHNYSETTSSQEARGAGLVSPPPHGDPSRSQSQDAYSFAAYSLQYSSHGRTPRQHDIAGSGSPLSLSATPHQSPQSASLVASSASRRGSLAADGYYYGYDLNAASASQQSVASNSAAEAS